jgi:hypothetical protein
MSFVSFELNAQQIENLKSKLPNLDNQAVRDLEEYYLDSNTEITVDDLIDLKKRYKLDLTDDQKEHVVVREFELELDKFNERLRLEQERIDNELLMQKLLEESRQRRKIGQVRRGHHFKKSKSKTKTKTKTKKSKTKKSKV